MKINKVHHIAIIASDYDVSKRFYTEVLGMTLVHEYYREQRHSYKADLYLNDEYTIELFSFPHSPQRLSYPEATGLRHLAFEVDNIEEASKALQLKGVQSQPIRVDEYTGKRFFFFSDPDDLPIEFYEK